MSSRIFCNVPPHLRLLILQRLKDKIAKHVAKDLKLSQKVVEVVKQHRHEYCNRCGSPLPCLKCASRLNKIPSSRGKEPEEGDESLQLSPEVQKKAELIRASWTPAEERFRRTGKWSRRRIPALDENPYTILVSTGRGLSATRSI